MNIMLKRISIKERKVYIMEWSDECPKPKCEGLEEIDSCEGCFYHTEATPFCEERCTFLGPLLEWLKKYPQPNCQNFVESDECIGCFYDKDGCTFLGSDTELMLCGCLDSECK